MAAQEGQGVRLAALGGQGFQLRGGLGAHGQGPEEVLQAPAQLGPLGLDPGAELALAGALRLGGPGRHQTFIRAR